MPGPLILSFDTSAAHCAAALLRDGRVLAARTEPMAKGQAERLFPLLAELLETTGHDWRAVGRIGVGTGPGNFTGIRLAVSAARGLALSLGVPAIGVSAFQAAALDAAGRVLVIGDARAGRIHAQAFADGAPTDAATLLAPADLPRHLPPGARLICAGPLPEGIALPWSAPACDIAVAIARIAAAGTPGERPAPMYLRAADAAPPAEPPPVILP